MTTYNDLWGEGRNICKGQHLQGCKLGSDKVRFSMQKITKTWALNAEANDSPLYSLAVSWNKNSWP